ncbi:GNAT family N-acetyltransferase [Kribbella italica]|uniref:Ribosomal protein S18 acetylase RimI-like enzyme n=1 Tax=Kribbella italica TaxID=1540520 RepID=A0A7W9MSU4_9ACTN|nr:GNAT family N-acetyltransferase [Kribbella italica]MBB5834527.1 ribosomal protein S18 acetylase RimI-like enzyme [Kribbella italica]
MTIERETPAVGGLELVAARLAEWQVDGSAVQLHPGDLGWFWRYGAERTAAAVRTWARDGELLAVGMLDEPDLLRVAIAPGALEDEELARRIAADVADPAAGVLVEGKVYLETPNDCRVRDLLFAEGWELDDPWQPLERDLTDEVEDSGLAVELVTAETAGVRVGIQRASFDGSTFSDERWQAMADGTPYARARCLIGRDANGEAVAAITVWSAGKGRPGLIEPLGVHRNHRGHGYGRAMTLAGTAALRELGASRAQVLTPCFNAGAIATYRSAGFGLLPQRRDQYRKV